MIGRETSIQTATKNLTENETNMKYTDRKCNLMKMEQTENEVE